MKKMYGKTARVSVDGALELAGRGRCSPSAKSSVSGRAKRTPSTVTASSATSDTPRTRAKKRRAASSPSFASFSDRTGTTALVTAPSASSDRSEFGMVKAIRPRVGGVPVEDGSERDVAAQAEHA